jgi:hypothetical protein
MVIKVAALSLPPGALALQGAPLIPELLTGTRSTARAKRSLLADAVDWAVNGRLDVRVHGLSARLPDRAERLALVANHLTALADLSRLPAAAGLRLDSSCLLVDAGELKAGEETSEAGGQRDAQDDRLLISTQPDIGGPRHQAIAGALRGALHDFAGKGPILVVGSLTRAQGEDAGEAFSAADVAMGKGRSARPTEAGAERAVWEGIEARLNAMQAAVGDDQAFLSRLDDLLGGLKARGELRAQLMGARSIVTEAVIGGMRPLVQNLRNLLSERSLDSEQAFALLQSGAGQARQRVRVHDERVAASLHDGQLEASEWSSPVAERSTAGVTPAVTPLTRGRAGSARAVFGEGRLAKADEAACEQVVWMALHEKLELLSGLRSNRSRFADELEALRRGLGSKGNLKRHLLGARIMVRDPLLDRLLPLVKSQVAALHAGSVTPDQAWQSVRALVEELQTQNDVRDALLTS